MIEIYRQAEEAGKGYESLGEFSLAKFMSFVTELPIFREVEQSIGIQRTKSDYIEITFDSGDVYYLNTRRISKDRTFFSKLFGSQVIEKKIEGVSSVKDVVNKYINVSREEFENEIT